MIYKTFDEKELFKKVIPEINKLKRLFEDNDLSGTIIESDLITCINNEISCTVNFKKKKGKRLKTHFYKRHFKNLNKPIKNKIEIIVDIIIEKINNFMEVNKK